MAHEFEVGFKPAGPGARRCFYFYRLTNDLVSEFCVANSVDPDQYVETMADDGSMIRWSKRTEGDLVVFRSPDPMLDNRGLFWAYDRRLQIGEPAPRDVLEREALRCRVSAMIEGEQ